MIPYYFKHDKKDSYTLTVYMEAGGVLFCAATFLPLKFKSDSEFKYIQFFPSSKKILEGMEYMDDIDGDIYKEIVLPGLIYNWTLFGRPVINEKIESLFENTPDSYYKRDENGIDLCEQMYILPSHLRCN